MPAIRVSSWRRTKLRHPRPPERPAAARALAPAPPLVQSAAPGRGSLDRLRARALIRSPMPHGFVHLRLHTEYSLSDSVVRVPELVAAVAAAGMPVVAVTDQGNLFAIVKF